MRVSILNKNFSFEQFELVNSFDTHKDCNVRFPIVFFMKDNPGLLIIERPL